MQAGIQRFSRTKMVLPLRVWLDERVSESTPSQWAHTIDTCDVGCRIGGLRTELSPGQIITVQRGQHKAPFRVIWSRHLAANEHQAGIEALDHKTNIWAINPAATESRDAMADVAALRSSTVSSSSTVRSGIAQAFAPAITAQQQSILAAARRRLRLSLGLGFLLLSLASGLFLYHQVFSESAREAIEPLLPSPPTAEDLARITPKPHPMPVSLTRPLDASVSRLQVAEAPTGRLVYPVPPDDSLSGKVRLQIVIAANGLVKQIHVLSGKQPLAEAAAQAVRLWHYGSFQGSDHVIDRETSVTISFLGGDAVSLEFPSSHGQLDAGRSKND